jgi:hypothetical protein
MYRLGNPFARFPIPAGKKRTEASKGEPQLNMMRDNTDGLCNFAHCSMPFWMVLMTLNRFWLWVNSFFGELTLMKGSPKVGARYHSNYL